MSISWSYLYLGNTPRTSIKTNASKTILIGSQKKDGMKLNPMIGYQPARNKMDTIPHISKMLPYSPKKNKAKPAAEYSTL
jgi:hypothetical protein